MMRCQMCGSTEPTDIDGGPYSRCCNEPVIWTDEEVTPFEQDQPA